MEVVVQNTRLEKADVLTKYRCVGYVILWHLEEKSGVTLDTKLTFYSTRLPQWKRREGGLPSYALPKDQHH